MIDIQKELSNRIDVLKDALTYGVRYEADGSKTRYSDLWNSVEEFLPHITNTDYLSFSDQIVLIEMKWQNIKEINVLMNIATLSSFPCYQVERGESFTGSCLSTIFCFPEELDCLVKLNEAFNMVDNEDLALYEAIIESS